MSELQDKVAARQMRIAQKLDLLERQSMQLGAKAERERIIKLLIDKAIQSRLNLCDDEADVFDFAVAIIKAEQK